jgi:Ca2+-binding RTX toxin-like protein
MSAATPLDLVGNEIGQTIVGNAGTNIIDGRGGSDVLIGVGGADTFRFTTTLGAGNVDRIDDFQPGTDKIALDDAVFAGLAPGALAAGAFVVGTQAADADDRIVYDQAAGRLFFDSDGNGAAAAVQFASVSPGLVLAASDFIVI